MHDTQRRILKATVRMFNQYGPMVPMAKISEAADVAAGTPFRYYKTKEELLRAAYFYARRTSFDVLPPADMSVMHGEELVKCIVRGILHWSAMCPQEHQYVCKYEDAECYDCFSERFEQEFYVGIIRELDIWDRVKDEVRTDLPEQLISRLISVNCSVYSRYLQHHHTQVDSPEYLQLLEVFADSVWSSIKRI